uniref:Uncharacterized protein n=1 Tax=Nucleocytoviricota sp. TaxID=2809609 RepID=A0A9E8JWV9_9VIRU|nr:hypothetical protein [Nucleocytoviricota sp.]UZT29190.1 hypothetical protein [Nucleocytoviricota sp.]
MNLFGFLKLDKSKKRRRRRSRVQKHKKERMSTRKYRRNKKGG